MPRIAVSIVALILLQTVSQAQENVAPEELAAMVAPYINARTSMVGHIDVSRVDVEALQQWCVDRINASDVTPEQKQDLIKELDKGKQIAGTWLDNFKKAGAHHVFFIAHGFDREPILAVTMKDGGDANAISALLVSGDANGPTRRGTFMAEPRGSIVVFGRERDLNNLDAPAARADFDEAWKTTGNAPARFVLIPSEADRQTIEQEVPQLPGEVGGGPTAPLSRGFKWGAAVADVPPKLSAMGVVKMADVESANQVHKVITAGLNLARQQFQAHAARMPQGEAAAMTLLLGHLSPTRDNDRLTLSFDEQKLAQIGESLIPSALHARKNAIRVQSASNMRQILMATIMFVNDNNGAWPADLNALKDKYLGGPRADEVLLKNPQQPQRASGYVYIRPGEKTPPPDRMILYEAHDSFGEGINAGFADGHVEFISKKDAFDQYLLASQEAAEQ